MNRALEFVMENSNYKERQLLVEATDYEKENRVS